MHLIAKEGIETKHTPYNTEESILTSCYLNFLDGVYLSLRYTKDEHIVISKEDCLENFTCTGCGPIEECTLELLRLHQTGSPVKRHSIITLEEVLTIFTNHEKMLILRIDDQGDRTESFIKNLLELLDRYSSVNVFLASASKDVLKMLEKNYFKGKVGLIVRENYDDWKETFDFYIVPYSLFSYEEIKKKIKDNYMVMIDELDDEEDFFTLLLNAKDLANDLYFISSRVGAIYEILRKNFDTQK